MKKLILITIIFCRVVLLTTVAEADEMKDNKMAALEPFVTNNVCNEAVNKECHLPRPDEFACPPDRCRAGLEAVKINLPVSKLLNPMSKRKSINKK